MSDRPDDISQRTIKLQDGTSVRLCHQHYNLYIKIQSPDAGTWYEVPVDVATWRMLISAAAMMLDGLRASSAPRLRTA